MEGSSAECAPTLEEALPVVEGVARLQPVKAKKKKKAKTSRLKEAQQLAEKHRLPHPVDEQTTKDLSRQQDNAHLVFVKGWAAGPTAQTRLPTVPIQWQFPQDAGLPPGLHYPDTRRWGAEIESPMLQMRDEMLSEKIYCLRRAAEVHRQVRKYAQQTIRPGRRMLDICADLEATLRFVIDAEGLTRGQAFPTGCSLNNVAAHYTPNSGDETVLGAGDVCKIDFGTHFNGYLVDSAFTVAFDPAFEPLLRATHEATAAGVREAGVDQRLAAVGEAIQEVMESHEVELNGKTYQVQSVRNLCGHTIDRYRVHAGKSVPIVKGGPQTKMEEGEIYAIETFDSTGRGEVHEDPDCSHYMRSFEERKVAFKHPRAQRLLNHINKHHGTLAFCRRWLDEAGEEGHVLPLRELVERGVVRAHPPLSDVRGSYVAQFEHTLLLKASGKEVMSVGDDY